MKLNAEIAEIFVFCDVTLKGHGSVAYIRELFSCDTSFFMSKTRVVPFKKITLPRFELLGAFTAVRLANYFNGLFRIVNDNFLLFQWFSNCPALD